MTLQDALGVIVKSDFDWYEDEFSIDWADDIRVAIATILNAVVKGELKE